jgi:hypothetical protein
MELETSRAKLYFYDAMNVLVIKRNYSAHPVHDHSPALDSGFRRNDVSYYAVFKSLIPAKSGAIRYPGLFLYLLTNYMIMLNSYHKTT